MKGKNSFRIAILAASVVGITVVHYFTPLRLHVFHDIFQRLYYLPIIFAAFWFGLRGGLVVSLAASILYIPHVVFQWGGHLTLEMEKYLEILLFNVVGAVTGFLSEREDARRVQLEKTAQGLEDSYRKLQNQADLIIRIEEQLRKAERLSALGELSATLAHEVRNPLGSIRGTAEILKEDFPTGSKKFEFLEILLKETDRLNRVVEEFLHFARPVPPPLGTCDLAAELAAMVKLLENDALAYNVRIDIHAAEIVPEVTGDCERLRQVFLNLMLNAIQSMPHGGSLEIAPRLLPPQGERGGKVEIRFSDTGGGIASDDLPHVFEPFFTTKSGGTGLGLAVTQKIVESHGGSISVESELGKGTTFRVRLPV
ncbi:MAG: sensor histidine kinase [Geobacter sp.]|nr:sensor histidine kinase [Geobacter sp.]